MEHAALREEILSTQRRSLQTIGAGALGLPAISYLSSLAASHDVLAELNAVKVALPPAVAVIVLFFVADNEAILRCGRYVREVIEPQFNPCDGGWEEWLERDPDFKRTTERYVTVAVSLMFLLYYAGASWFAMNYAFVFWPEHAWVILHVCNIAIAAWLSLAVARRVGRMTTSRPLRAVPSTDLEAHLHVLSRLAAGAELPSNDRSTIRVAAIALCQMKHMHRAQRYERGYGLSPKVRKRLRELGLLE